MEGRYVDDPREAIDCLPPCEKLLYDCSQCPINVDCNEPERCCNCKEYGYYLSGNYDSDGDWWCEDCFNAS